MHCPRAMTIDFREKIARYPCQATLVCDCAIHTIVFFGEFGLTSAASRQNSSEQNGRSTYCAAKTGPAAQRWIQRKRCITVYGKLLIYIFIRFLTVREKYAYTTIHRHSFLGCGPLELADNSQALIHIALFLCASLLHLPSFQPAEQEDMGSIRSPCSLQKDVYAP